MQKLILTIIILFAVTNSFCQTQSILLIGELTIHQSDLDGLRVGDTLTLDFAKKKSAGTIRIDKNKTLYEWNCNDAKTKRKANKSNWCKIGLWQIDNDQILFTLIQRTIKFSYMPVDNNIVKRFLIVTKIKSSS